MNNFKKILPVLALAVLVVGLGSTQKGRELSNSLLKSLGADAAGASRYQVSVGLSIGDGRTYEYQGPVDDASFRALRNDPDATRDKFILLAKKAMAEKFGYSEARYGADNIKVLAARVTTFNVVDTTTGQTQDMFRDERRRGAFNNLYSE